MDSHDNSQLELFSQVNKYGATRVDPSRSFLNRVRAYEKIILIAMGFIVTAIISFSLGVEKGRKVAGLKQDLRFDTANKKQTMSQSGPLNSAMKPGPPPPQAIPQVTIQKSNAVIPAKPKDSLQSYTIQLASYKSRSSAQKEAGILNKRGLLPLMVTKGEYIVLYVGRFSDKETAKALLSELEKRYHGCFVRRI